MARNYSLETVDAENVKIIVVDSTDTIENTNKTLCSKEDAAEVLSKHKVEWEKAQSDTDIQIKGLMEKADEIDSTINNLESLLQELNK